MSRYTNVDSLFLEPKTTQYGEHMVMTNVQKPTKLKYFCIDTTFAEDCGVGGALPSAAASRVVHLEDRANDVVSLTVLSAEIPMSFYNISASLGNNAFTLVDTAGKAYVVTVVDGTYTAATLPAAVNTALSVAGANSVTFMVSGSKSRLSTASTAYTLYLDALSALREKSPAMKSSLGWLLGFRCAASSIASWGSLLSPAWLDLGGPRYLYLVLDDFSNGSPNSMLVPAAGSLLPRNVLSRITVDTSRYASGSVAHAYQNDGSLVSDVRRYSSQINFNKVRVQIVNAFGASIDFNGLPFSFVLQIEHV